MDVIKSADWVIDLGPEAGGWRRGLVYAGIPPRTQKKTKESSHNRKRRESRIPEETETFKLK